MRALKGEGCSSSSRLPGFAVRDGVEASDVEAAKNPDLPGIMSLGSGDDDVISAMLESSHSQGSLAGVMAPLTGPDIYASFSSHAAAFHQHQAPGGGGLARASSLSQAGLSRQPQQQQQRSNERWDDKWMLDAKGEVLAMHSSAFGADFDSFMMPPASSGGGGGLHRYHSAPSTVLQALADDAFAQIPLLTPITEQMDVERGASGSGSEFEQFLAPDSEFSRRAALSALAKPETTELVRQNSLPVAQPRQDPPEEHHSEESLSGTSEDSSLKTSMYHDLFPRDSWPTSPGTSKRQRGFPLESDPAAAGEFRNGLIRHASLPTPSASAAAAAPSADDHYVQMRARAKRGCATHPRSIAERVRRTRISERMKKLQDLVPNMEKTTNTSDMLDETVEYVKSLQMQVNELNETIAKLRDATHSTASP